jgi:hypothetical protein
MIHASPARPADNERHGDEDELVVIGGTCELFNNAMLLCKKRTIFHSLKD